MRPFTFIFLLLATVTQAYGDVVYLKNGDRITGKVKEIWDNDIIIEPTYDDDTQIKISLDIVDYLDSDRQFEVVLKDGRKVTAELAGRGPEGKQRIMIDGKTALVSLSQLEELDEIEDYFDWESHIDINFSIDKGNTDALNSKFFADTNLKLGDHRHTAALTLNREEQNGISTKEQDLLQYNYNWVFSEPWFFGVASSFERDPIRSLAGRFILGATAGRDIFNRPRVFLSFQAGSGYLTERSSDSVDAGGNPVPGSSQQSVIAIWITRYRQDFFAEDLELYHDNSINAYLTGRSNFVLKTITGLRYDLTDLLYFNTQLELDYESEPSGNAKETDLSLVVGLGFEF